MDYGAVINKLESIQHEQWSFKFLECNVKVSLIIHLANYNLSKENRHISTFKTQEDYLKTKINAWVCHRRREDNSKVLTIHTESKKASHRNFLHDRTSDSSGPILVNNLDRMDCNT